MVPVLRAGPVERRRPGLAVDEHHVVAFAVPVVRVALETIDVQVGAAVDAVAFDVADDVVFSLAQIRPARIVPVDFRLEPFSKAHPFVSASRRH